MRKYSRSLAVTLLVSLAPLVLPLSPHVALAQTPPAPGDPTIQAAHARFAEGVAFYDKGQFENARASFLQAYALHKHPAVLINLAQSSLRSGHTLEADRFFTRYIHESAALTPAQRAEAEKGLTEARTKLGRIDVLAPAGTAVTIDGEVAGTDGPATLDVEPGAHSVKGGTESSNVTVAAGQTVMVKLGKVAADAAPIPIMPVPEPLPPVVAPPVEPPPPAAEPSSTSIFSRPSTMAPVWIGAGVGFAGFVTAIILGVSKGNAVDSYNSESAVIVQAVGATHASGACVNPKSAQLAGGCSALTNDASDVQPILGGRMNGVAVGAAF